MTGSSEMHKRIFSVKRIERPRVAAVFPRLPPPSPG